MTNTLKRIFVLTVTISQILIVGCASEVKPGTVNDFIDPIEAGKGGHHSNISSGLRGKCDYAVSRESIPAVFSNPKSVKKNRFK